LPTKAPVDGWYRYDGDRWVLIDNEEIQFKAAEMRYPKLAELKEDENGI
jgi:hypothetical protein